MKKISRRIIVLLLAGILLVGSLTVPAFAEETAAKANTQQKVTIKKQKFTTKTKTAKKKALAVKTGATIVKMPSGGMGYLKFTAPEKGKYKFIFYDLKKKDGFQGYVSLQSPKTGNTKKLLRKKVKTWGGSTTALWIGDKDYKSTKHPKVEWPRKNRSTKANLKKGETIYIFFSFAPKDTLNMKIAKI